jgi:hypothetical protein
MTTEADYVQRLEHERHMFAWCLVEHGEVATSTARTHAEEHYPYEDATLPYRLHVFHDLAWHYAMQHLHGGSYWRERPELESPTTAYMAESGRWRAGASSSP